MQPFLLTIALMLAAVSIAVPVGVGGALAAVALGGGSAAAWGRRLFFGALAGSAALPLYLQAAGWESAAGKFGWLPLTQTGAAAWSLAGFTATAWIHGVTGACWVALATAWGLWQVPQSVLDQAALDAPRASILGRIALPMAMPAIAAGALWVALLAATEMTVADLYGVRTLADEVYLRYAMDPEPVPILLSCLTPAIVALPLAWLIAARAVPGLVWRGSAVTGGGAAGMPSADPFGLADGDRASSDSLLIRSAAWLVVAGLLVLVVGVPAGGLLIKAGWVGGASGNGGAFGWSPQRALRTVGQAAVQFAPEYRWTAALAVATALPALVIGWVAAAWADGSLRRTSAALAVAVLMVLVPGPVMAIGVIGLFHGHDWGLGWLYERTIVPTVVALLPRAVPAAYLVMRAGYRLQDATAGQAAAVDGAGPLQRFWWIDAPRLIGAALVASGAAALVATADVPATLVVMPPGVSTVGTRLFGLLHSGVRYQEAGLAIWMLLAWIGMAAAIGLLWTRRVARSA